MPLCSSSASEIWRLIVRTGFSEVIGSWKIIAMSLPRMRRMPSSFSLSRSCPSNRTSPSSRRRRLVEPADHTVVRGLPDDVRVLLGLARDLPHDSDEAVQRVFVLRLG